MASLTNKLISKLYVILIIVLFAVAFREMIIAYASVSTAFGELMGALPFAKKISDIICKILKYDNEIKLVTAASKLEELLKLSIMSFVKPVIIGLLSSFFLPLPQTNDWEVKEKYMNSIGYKIKEVSLNVIATPFIAVLVAKGLTELCQVLSEEIGPIGTEILELVLALVMSGVSAWELAGKGTPLVRAILWRLLITLAAKMTSTLVTEVLCLAIYIALLGGIQHDVEVFVLATVVWLIIEDFGIGLLKWSICGGNSKNYAKYYWGN